ncbi:DHA2 family multidrug resistance protein-like MFS transporter [Microbacterium resistens]|uniref:DHA2 family multidrug resistance protein-like MFS transporter n=1 Tax=Microbacterium resistens TaxID=156977 RepID=A0ABU1S7Q1_9MICO|nr:MFS transporter [Microbacterium resistens]MDR6865655.1 DHA2 family multidrug resistance protein-like MFS transporter [Microbacterium resistens]
MTTPAEKRATPRTWIGLAVLVLPMLLISIDGMVLMFGLPAITEELKPSGAEQLWMLDIYALMIAGLLITMSSIGDRIGRRRLLMIGAVGFVAASILGALATAPWMLILSRALLGVAGATIMPSTLSLIRNMFLDRAQRRGAMAVWAAMASVGAAGGPIVGGWIMEHFTWHVAFLMNIPVMVLLLILAPFFIPESRNPAPGRIDPFSVVLSLVGMIAVVYGIKTLAEGKSPWSGLAVLVAGLVLLVVFGRRQLRIPDPMINVRLFRVRAFSGAVIVDLVSVFALVGSLFALTQYLQLVVGLTPIQSALWLLPEAAVSATAGFIAAALVKRVPASVLVAVGAVVTAGGFALLLTLTPHTSPVVIAVSLCLVGLGAGVGLTLTNDIIMSSVRSENAGQAAAVSETAYELGTALGTAILGSVLLAFYRSGLADGAALGVPESALAAAEETLASALAIAAELPGTIGASLADLATGSFSQASAWTGGIGAVLMIGAAVFAGITLRGVSSAADLTEADAVDAGH